MWRIEQIMGMPIKIDVRDRDIDPIVIDAAFDWLRWVDETFSTHKPESQISRLNSGFQVSTVARSLVEEVLERCDRLRKDTNGYFDIHTERLPLPLETKEGGMTSRGIDPSGLVKGWAVNRLAEGLAKGGAANYCVNAGGDVLIRGAALPASTWRIGIRHPFEQDKVAAVVEANDLAIATSGAYARGHHIINPYTGLPPAGVLSVTITGPDLGTADAYATAAFAMGEEGPGWTMGLDGYESLTILDSWVVTSTPGFPKI